MSEVMMGYGAVAEVEEFDEEFVREKLRELLGKALLHRYDFRGLEATRDKVMWELINVKANYQRYGEVYVELTNKAEVGVEKACRVSKKVIEEALEHFEELKIWRTGRTQWKVKLPGKKWRLYIHRTPAGYWVVEVVLLLKIAKLRLPDVLRLPPELLVAAQEGWVLGDASYIADCEEAIMGTSQTWQAVSFPGFWPGKEVVLYVRGIAINEKRHVSIMWQVRVKGVRNAPKVWALKKEEKRKIAIAEIEEANKGNIDEQRALRIALYYAADGKYSQNSTARVLLFAVGKEQNWVRTEGSVRIARLLYEKAPQLLEYMAASGCKKAMFLARLALIGPRKLCMSYQRLGLYAPVAGALLNLVMVAVGDEYAYIYARIPVSNAPPGWYERAVKEGWTVNVVRSGETPYYEIPQDSLFERAAEDSELWEALYAFAKAKAEVKPAAKKLVEELLKIRPAGARN
ncbi:hypothetical protein [Thermofilum pendens]|uniref:Uncharacterized protein n=1 Tax=Thermofilum pendens (strain DSM 2475 / Hrk 5) TaxID=368408 RepID=A1RXD8_THEPD|nr:hypothetical protein [Thermofilum pendens]ABL77868.1 hypothetical protein Tpen_0459 [Thermofilum pendens Hrk 5]